MIVYIYIYNYYFILFYNVYILYLIVAQLLIQLIQSNKVEIALQLSFDIYSHANHQLIMPLCQSLKEYQKQPENINNPTIINLLKILDGSFPHDQQLSFLWKNNHSDMLIMKELKDGVEKSSSVLNHATIVYYIYIYIIIYLFIIL